MTANLRKAPAWNFELSHELLHRLDIGKWVATHPSVSHFPEPARGLAHMLDAVEPVDLRQQYQRTVAYLPGIGAKVCWYYSDGKFWDIDYVLNEDLLKGAV